jgi:transposase InsO family protein
LILLGSDLEVVMSLVVKSVIEQRMAAVLEVVNQGRTVTEVAVRYGVARQTVHRWLRRYEADGLDGLEDRSHRPKGCPHQMPARVEASLVALRVVHPHWGPQRLAWELEQRGIVDAAPSASAIYRCLRRHGLVQARKRRRRREDYKRWQRQRPMELWQLDIVGGVALENGRYLKVVNGIDDHSRFCVLSAVVAAETSRAVAAAFVGALRRYGVPDEVLTDNGTVFTGRRRVRPGEVLFERICRENGITPRLTAPRSPTTTGKVERFHKTMKIELLRGRKFADLDEAQAAIDDWVEEYNHRRPHQALDMATPAERFTKTASDPIYGLLEPSGAPPKGQLVIERRVAEGGVISVAGETFSVGRHLAYRIVTIAVNGRIMHIYLNGTHIKTLGRQTDKPIRQIQPQKTTRRTKHLETSGTPQPKQKRNASTAT